MGYKTNFVPEAKKVSKTRIDKVLEGANQKAIDTLGLDGKKFEDALGINKSNTDIRDNNKFLGLNKWLLISSLVVIGGAIAYKVYNKNK